MVLWGSLRSFEILWGHLRSFEALWGPLMSFEVFQCLRTSERFWFDVFWCILMSSDVFRWLLMAWGYFWCLSMFYDAFRCLLMSFEEEISCIYWPEIHNTHLPNKKAKWSKTKIVSACDCCIDVSKPSELYNLCFAINQTRHCVNLDITATFLPVYTGLVH